MISDGGKLSESAIIFLSNLRNFIEANGMKIQDLFTRCVCLQNGKEISRMQFSKIVKLFKPNSKVFQIWDVFSQFKCGYKSACSLSVKRFITVFNQQITKIPTDSKPQINTTAPEQKQLQAKTFTDALNKLIQEMKMTGLELFNKVDQRGLGYLTSKEFNKLLIATELSQFNDKQMRDKMIKVVFRNYSTGKITKKDFISIFKIQPKKQDKPVLLKIQIKPQQQPQQQHQKNNLYQSSNRLRNQTSFKKLDIPKNNYVIPPSPKSPLDREMRNSAFFQKMKVLKNSYDVPPRPKSPLDRKTKNQASFQNIHIPKYNYDMLPPASKSPLVIDHKISQAFYLKRKFPLAHQYYQSGVPLPDELQYFETLQRYLSEKKIYHDKSNPKTHDGTYLYSTDIFKSQKYQVFSKTPSAIQEQKSTIELTRQNQPKVIKQGSLGNCYFISSMTSIVSLHPQLIFNQFLFSVNQAHFYVVKLFIDGQWQYITTDDQFPCQNGKSVFAKPHGNEIWVMLLQKCFAKVFGSYKAICSGISLEASKALSGAPCQYFIVKKQQDKIKIKDILEQASEKRYAATTADSQYLNNLSKDQQKQIGLVSNHTYSFLQIFKINEQIVVKLRNPWGKSGWKGQWCFQSKNWTQQLRQKYNYFNATDDGSFYMPWDQFIKYFSSFVICKIDPTFVHTSLRLRNNQPYKQTYLRLIVNEEGTYHFSVYQQSKRKNANIKDYQYSHVRVILVKDNKDESQSQSQSQSQYQYINSVNNCRQGCTSFETCLQRGTYLLSIKAEWIAKNTYPLVFNSYGVQKIQIEEISQINVVQFNEKIIKSYSKKFKGEVSKYSQEGQEEAYSEKQISMQRGIGYIRMKNQTKIQFKAVLTMEKFQGLQLFEPYKLPLQFDMKPNAEYVVGIWVSGRGYSFSCSTQRTFK